MDQLLKKYFLRVDYLLDWLFPPQCAGCDREGVWLCHVCQKKLTGPLYRSAIGQRKLVVTSLAAYQDKIIKTALWRVKYQSVQAYVEILVKALIKRLPKHFLSNDNLLVPIPLSSTRQRWRGFNQAELLAQKISVVRGGIICAALAKKSVQATQVSQKTRQQRLENIKGTFALTGAARQIKGKDIVLIDDVVTTGATLAEAAKMLRAMHPKSIRALTLARE